VVEMDIIYNFGDFYSDLPCQYNNRVDQKEDRPFRTQPYKLVGLRDFYYYPRVAYALARQLDFFNTEYRRIHRHFSV